RRPHTNQPTTRKVNDVFRANDQSDTPTEQAGGPRFDVDGGAEAADGIDGPDPGCVGVVELRGGRRGRHVGSRPVRPAAGWRRRVLIRRCRPRVDGVVDGRVAARYRLGWTTS